MGTRFTYRLQLDASKVIQMCIDNQYYTCGDCEEYGKMLTYVCEHEIKTEADLLWIANDIISHSNPNTISEDDLELVVWALLNKCGNITVEENDCVNSPLPVVQEEKEKTADIVACISERITEDFEMVHKSNPGNTAAFSKLSKNLEDIVHRMFNSGLLWNSEKIELWKKIQLLCLKYSEED